MKLLIIGVGRVGTIYGWALSEAGIDVKHKVRSGRKIHYDKPIQLDVLDLRYNKEEYYNSVYHPQVTDTLNAEEEFDLVMIPTKHYQLIETVREYKDQLPDTPFILFTGNWEGSEQINEMLGRERYIWGYAAASGGFYKNKLLLNLREDYRTGILPGNRGETYKLVMDMFNTAGLVADEKKNIVHWCWIHHAINSAIIGAALYAGGLNELMDDVDTARRMILATRESLGVAKARGVNVEEYPDAQPFLHVPIEQMLEYGLEMFTKGPIAKRTAKAGHFQDSPEEMKRFYFDVLHTGEELGLEMPNLKSFEEKIGNF